MRNEPYVKKYSETTGELLNPIKGYYISHVSWRDEAGKAQRIPNRRERRAMMANKRPNNHFPQLIWLANGQKKTIYHHNSLLRSERC